MDYFGHSGWRIIGLEINNPLNTEIIESGPGAPFSTALGAAINFGMLYNGYSIINHVEVGTIIYKIGGKYKYEIPVIGSQGFIHDSQMQKVLDDVNKIKGASIEAIAHTHGSEDSSGVKKGLGKSESSVYSGDYYKSTTDRDIAIMKNWGKGNIYGRPIDGYLAAPDGGLYYFSPNINYTNTKIIVDGKNFLQYQIPIYSGLPSDSGLTNKVRNERRNTIAPVIIPNLKIRY